MDNRRGNFFGHGYMDSCRDAGEDHIAPEPPPASVGQDERRMQVRAYNYWASLLGDRPVPEIEDLISATLPDFADHAVMLDFSAAAGNPLVTMLGAKLAEECGVDASIERLSEVPVRSLLSRITDHCMQILASEAPIGFEAEFVNQRGKTLLYRGILLPFSGDGKSVQHIMGVINWKELADPSFTAELRHELEIATATAHPHPAGLRLGAWADGPAAAEPGDREAGLPLTSRSDSQQLAERLTAAREAVEVANATEDRSRAALYAAIGRAWDLAVMAQDDPLALRKLLAEAGLTRQATTGMTQVVKLVFGTDYDKARLAAFAVVLAHARRHRLESDQLGKFLTQVPGGLEQIVSDERALRRAEKAGRNHVIST